VRGILWDREEAQRKGREQRKEGKQEGGKVLYRHIFFPHPALDATSVILCNTLDI